MHGRQYLPWLAALTAPLLQAQYAAPPSAYTVTEINSTMGAPATMKIYRDGSKAVIERESPSPAAGGKPAAMRSFFDIEKHQGNDWSLSGSAPACGSSSFSGGWGDPFAASAEVYRQLASAHPVDAGTATVAGMSARIVEAVIPQGKACVWFEPKYGLVLKLEFTMANSPPQTLIEVTQVSLAPPPAAVFVLPASCKSAGPPPPTDEERLAAETGGNAADFMFAMYGPASANSCTVILRVVRAGSMTPITSGFQVALDRTVDADHTGGQTIGLDAAGHATFSGGGVHEVTGQLQNGVLRIGNPPAQFDIETAFGDAGSSSALIYRQCFGPQTVLLYVVKNPGKLSDGADWLWVKSGKFAAAPALP
jgi:hypothetical protein